MTNAIPVVLAGEVESDARLAASGGGMDTTGRSDPTRLFVAR